MESIRLFDEAELKSEFRRLYREKGFNCMVQVLFELVMSAQFCTEVMHEERTRELNEEKK